MAQPQAPRLVFQIALVMLPYGQKKSTVPPVRVDGAWIFYRSLAE